MSARHKEVEMDIPTSSMGDIAFLLIIFFMVCSVFAKQAGINVNPPRSPDVSLAPNAPVEISITQESRIHLQGKLVPDAEAIEWGVAALLKGKTADDQRTVLFRCDRSVPKDIFEPVLAAIAKGGGIPCAIGDKGDVPVK